MVLISMFSNCSTVALRRPTKNIPILSKKIKK